MLGYGQDELSHVANIADLYLDPAQREEVKRLLNERGHLEDFPIHLRRKDGKAIWMSIYVQTRRNEDGTVQSYDGFTLDITQRKLVEEELRQAHRMEAIATLTGGIAHDYNNLMAIIMGNLSMAMEEMKPDSFTWDFLNNAVAASHKVKNLTHELMSLSRSGTLVLETGSFEELLKSASSVLPAGGLYFLKKSIATDLRLFPYDLPKMAAVLRNVVTNAVEAMPGGGTIEIIAKNQRVVREDTEPGLPLKPGEYIHISIQDQGVGIPKENLEKIFDPYFSTKAMGTQKGMGLGLTTAYAIVNQHGGRLAIDSTPGVGTTVHIYLAAERQTRKAGQSASSKETAPSVKRVLVMDDEEMLRDLAEKMLKRLGYDAETVKDGMDAIHLYRERLKSHGPFDAVILDLTIKDGMGGEQTMEELLAIDPNVKAVVSSGYFNNPVLSDFEKYGFVGKIAKPYEMKNLREVLERIFE